MQNFIYVARDPKTGQRIEAEVDAQDEASAARLLAERGLAPLEIRLKKEPLGGASFFKRIPPKQKVIFSRQLSTLINAGLPLVQSLNTVQGQTANQNLKAIIGKVINDVEAGSALADALGKYPEVFDDVYISLIAAGEASGTLDVSLQRLANQQEKDAEMVSKLRGALFYPLIVMIVLAGVVTFMMTTVLPQVESLYAGLPGTKLPLVTQLLLGMAKFILHFWWLILLLLVGGGWFGWRWSKQAAGKQVVDRLKMRLPGLGPLFMKIYMARFARTAATLVASGVPMIKMLDTSARAVGNVHIALALNKATEQVRGGKALSAVLSGDSHFLELVPNMIHIGEQSGQLDGMLTKLADYYEKEVDNQIKSISTVIEPILMIIVGIVALVVVAAVLLPIYSLAGKNLIHQ